MSGFIVKKILSKNNCNVCKKYLSRDKNDCLISLREMDDTTRLFYPSEFVIKILKVAENILIVELEKNWLQKRYFFDFVQIKVCNAIVSLYGNLFKTMDNHAYENVKIIVTCYVTIRFKSHAKLKNERIKKKRLRTRLNKLIIQNHQ